MRATNRNSSTPPNTTLSIDRYFREMGRSQLLTRQQEAAICKQLDVALFELHKRLAVLPVGQAQIASLCKELVSDPSATRSTQRKKLERLAELCERALAGAHDLRRRRRHNERKLSNLEKKHDADCAAIRRQLKRGVLSLDDLARVVARIEGLSREDPNALRRRVRKRYAMSPTEIGPKPLPSVRV